MNEPPQPLGVWQMIGLHLIPGVLITAFSFLTAPVVIRAGYPPMMSLLLAILFVLIPFELGFLLYEGRKLDGRISLKGVVLFRDRVPTWQLVLLIAALVVWSGLMFSLFSIVDSFFARALFSWFPSWALPENTLGDISQYSRSALAITLIVGLALNGIAGPLVEELYFRGYLLPRIPSSRWWAPLINVLLFSLYHFFSPWQNVTRILALLPPIYTVAWKRNVSISIWTHCALNSLSMVLALALLFQ